MGFTAPLLSLTRFAWKIFPVAAAAGQPSAAWAASNDSGPDHVDGSSSGSAQEQKQAQRFQGTGAYPNVITLRSSRTRRRNSAGRYGKPVAAQQQLALPLQAADSTQPRLLRIVQREPQKQPECLLISGRMADVCAALERMAGAEQVWHA